jgi:DNA-binding MurR/RpiR family transcriptional regulator
MSVDIPVLDHVADIPAGEDLTAVIARRGPLLTAAEGRVARAIAESPDAAAFATVTELAERAAVGVATVMRASHKLGFDGYAQLQSAARAEMTRRLQSAAGRIRLTSDATAPLGQVDTTNIERTFDQVDPAGLERAITHLADLNRTVMALGGHGTRGLALQFIDELAALRPGCSTLEGSVVTVHRLLATLGADDVIVAIDVARYDRWLYQALEDHFAGIVIAITDHPLSPLAGLADVSVLVHTESAGPFESHCATLSVLQALTAGVAASLRDEATERLDRIESVWATSGLLVDTRASRAQR